jgi:acyl transferase domain-containing protein/NAD(P)-dependent dehydrogenase (short-subunit alcohol dehydrogenase family)/thioesterase domain-containing protein/acyl carrier protein
VTDSASLDRIQRVLTEELSQALQIDPSRIDPCVAFADFGLDSILSVRFIRGVNRRLDSDLEVTVVFDHRSVEELAAHLLARHGAPPAPEGAAHRIVPARKAARPKAVPRPPEAGSGAAGGAKGPIAIVGMSGRFARSDDLDALWEHLAAGRDLVGPVTRWTLPPESPCHAGSFLDDVARFDARFFNISGVEAAYMDPQQRIFLEEAWTALEEAGYAGAGVQGLRCGVYVGCTSGDYTRLFAGEPPHQAAWGNAASVIPARIAYLLDLKGPALAVDTACSSSLVAVHLACQALCSGEVEMALAGGVSVQSTSGLYDMAGRAGMLSPRGRCHAFDARADGFVPGEGAGVVVLKRLEQALADGDHVHGVIRGSAVNQDGATNGITAPSARSQERLQSRLYAELGIDPSTLGMVEAHGTGTELGDPIEFQALSDAFRRATDRAGFCALGSIKTNLGHTTTAAGVAGLFRVLLAMRHRQIPPSLHFRDANPGIRLDGSPFYVNTELEPWETAGGGPRRAAISSFGFSGTNAHAVIEEAPHAPRRHAEHAGWPVVLSAMAPAQLRRQAENLLSWCRRQPALDVGDLSFTLLRGRRRMPERLAFVAGTRAAVIEGLEGWLAGRPGDEPDLAAYEARFDGGGFTRLSLPTYPFARERHWCTGEASPLTFAEAWQAAPAPAPAPAAGIRTLACLGAGPERRRAVEAEVARLSPRTRVVFEMDPAADAVCVFGASDSAALLPLLQGTTARIVVAGEFHDPLERCHLESLIGIERSLPAGRFAVVMRAAGEAGPWMDALWPELAAARPESVLYENGERHVLRLAPLDAAEGTPVLREGGTYLVTGGHGGLGSLVARHLREKYRARLVLVGRSAPGATEADVLSLRADVTDRAQMESAWEQARARFGRIDGVVHAAGISGTQPLAAKTAAEWLSVLAPKVAGSRVVYELAARASCDFVCFFGSASAVLGDFGGCDYAVANRFQSALARYGGGATRAVAVQWPLWDEGGLRFESDEARRLYLGSSGQRALGTAEGLALFERLLAGPEAAPLVLTREPSRARAPEATVEDEVKRTIGEVLRTPVEQIASSSNLADLGFDSLSLVDLARALSRRFGAELTPSLFFSHPTVAKLARHLASPAPGHGERAAPPPRPEAARPGRDDDGIAIIGVSGRFPGARNADELWSILRDGASAVQGPPPGRRGGWRGSRHRCGFVPGVDEFEPLFFGISPREAETMDPRQRLLLQEAWNALEDAALGPAHLRNARLGMWVGAEEGDYWQLAGERGSVTANHNGILAARLPYLLDFKGPVMSVNTACSSGLVAAHLACQSLRTGECDVALAAGVNLMLTPSAYASMERAGMLSPDGTCRPFHEEAGGIVPGEAVVVLVLKRLSRARADGDPIHAVIRGSGVNYDGRTNGITAPSGAAQTALVRSVYEQYAIDPERIGCVVTHGTGTRLGDPVEVDALADAFRAFTPRQGFCALTSTKGNFGHTLAASGLVSLVALVRSLREGVIPRSLHGDRANPFIQWEGSPFFVNQETRPWPGGAPRQGAVSAFGISGTNAHLVVEAWAGEDDEGEERGPFTLPLSARTEPALRRRAGDLAAFLERGGASLAAVSRTLWTGRHPFEERRAFAAHDRGQAIRALREFAETGSGGHADDAAAPGPRGSRAHLPPYPFARETYWIDEPHPVLRPHPDGDGLHARLTGDEFFLRDHRFRGERVLPAAACLELACAAVADAHPGEAARVTLSDVVWPRPLVVGDTPREVRVSVTPQADGAYRFEVYGEGDGVYSRGAASCAAATEGAGGAPSVDLDAVRAGCTGRPPGVADCYAHYERRLLQFGPSMRAITGLRAGPGVVVAALRIPDDTPAHGFVLHPSLLDGALQASLGLWWTAGEEPTGRAALPFSLESLEVFAPCAASMWAVVRARDSGPQHIDVDLCDERGGVAVRLRGLACRVFERDDAPAGGEAKTLLLQPVWRRREALPSVPPPYDRRLVVPAAGGFQEHVGQLYDTLRELLSARTAERVLLQVVHPASAFGNAALAGLLRSAARENPRLLWQCVAVDDLEAAGLDAALEGCAADPRDPVVRYRDGARWVAGWKEVPPGTAAVLPWRADGVYLVTGGGGGLGRIFAAEIGRRAPGAVVVSCGRSAEGPGRYRQADVTDRAAVEKLVAGILAEHGRLNGVLHAAGVVRDGLLPRKTAQSIREVLEPKVAGLVHLDEATAGLSLDFLVCFASGAGALGNAGQTDYAAANAFLDAYAEHRNGLVAAGARHGRTLSVDWPMWREGGMRVDAAIEARIRETTGLVPLATEAGLDAFYRAWGCGAGQVLVLSGDEAAIRRLVEPRAVAFAPPEPLPPPTRDDFHDRAVTWFKEQISGAIKLPAARIDADAPMERYGIDSLLILDLTIGLEKRFGPLSKTLFFEHQTLRALTDHFILAHRARLEELLGGGTAAAGTSPVRTPAASPAANLAGSAAANAVESTAPGAGEPAEGRGGDVAIIGVAGRYPQAEDLQAFWSNLAEGRDCVTRIPAERWGAAEGWGGFLADVDCFDPRFFRISPREAELLDPQERIFLECAWATMEDAGYTRGALARRTGVFVGVMYEEYQLYGAEESLRGRPLALSGSPSSIANRVSYVLDLDGPSMAVDTMCSSSLTAIHLACASLRRGECAMAFAGGVNVSVHPNKYRLLGQGKFISGNGRCESFGQGGDGYVPAEGVGAVLLKPLRRAEADGDRILGVIRGTAVNHGGKTNGYTVPNPAAQTAVVARALEEARVPARAVSYVEAHGTGTSLGDPVEVAALDRVFRADGGEARFCALGSVKSNIGHCESAAGIAGVTKVLLQLQHRQLVPSLHSRTLNPYIDFAESAFVVQQKLEAWPRPAEHPCIAGVSSFGAGGANAHVVIAEYEPAGVAAPPAADGPFRIVLSARTPERLRVQAARLRDALPRFTDADLASIAYTLEVGRELMEERLAFAAGSLAEAGEKLAAFLAGVPAGEDVPARPWGPVKPRKVALPTYPFARERYWFGDPPPPPEPADSGMPLMTFAESWEEAPLPAASAGAGTLVCLLADPARRRELAALVPGARLVFVAPGHACGEDGLHGYTVDAAAAGSWRELFRRLDERYGRADAVCHLWQLDGTIAAADTPTLLPLLQGFAAAAERPRRLVLAGAFADPVERCHLESWIGIERSLALALPDTPVAVVLTALGPSHSALDSLRRELSSDARAVLYDEAGRRHLSRVAPAALGDARPVLREGGVYLVTGGLGALGAAVAGHLARRYRARLVVVGRSAPNAARVRELGPDVLALQADVADLVQMREVWRQARARFGRVDGIVHAAGVAGAPSLRDARWTSVLAPKVAGTQVLDAMAAGEPLDFICYFSSSSAVLGDLGGCEYAIGNRFQAAFARHAPPGVRRVAIQWPLWREGGMGPDDVDSQRMYLRSSGQRALETAEGLAHFEALLGQRDASFLVLAGDPARVHRFLGAGAGRARPAAPAGALAGGIEAGLQEQAAAILKLRPDELDPGVNLADFGFDSVSMVEYAGALSARFGVEVTPTLLFAHPTIGRLTAHLASIAPAGGGEAAADAIPPLAGDALPPAPAGLPVDERRAGGTAPLPRPAGDTAPGAAGEPIAIIGVSGRFPMADGLDQFWQNLVEGRDCITDVPPERWDWRAHAGQTRVHAGGFIDGIDEFDPLFFGISPREARLMDPQQRLLMTFAWKAIEDAGYSPASLAGSNTAIFVGTAATGYATLIERAGVPIDGYTSTGAVASVGPNRMSHFLDVHGPSEPIETACSSSLVAVRRGALALARGECDLAIVGAVNTILLPEGYVSFDRAGMLSPDGRCKTFSSRADGYGRGEGVGMLVLKRLSDAERDGDSIRALVRGSAQNHGGRANSLTAPNPGAQAAMLRAAYAEAGVDPRTVGYVEAHGTGTPLGDPIEVEALKAAFEPHGAAPHCGLGSVKSNIGHLELAAGMAGLIKVLLQMRHRTLAPTLHCDEVNPYIDLAGSAFHLVRQAQPWAAPRDAHGNELPRRAGVSSFGFGGVNAHVVLEEYLPPPSPGRGRRAPAGPAMVVLSARSEPQLREAARQLRGALAGFTDDDLGDIAYTLQVGRQAMEERLAIAADSLASLAATLDAFLDGRDDAAGLFRGSVKRHQEITRLFGEDDLAATLDRWVAEGRTARVLALWAGGGAVGWERLRGGARGRRVPLPGHPFARERYWVPLGQADAIRPRNTSDFDGVRFSTTLRGDEAFLRDHVVDGARVLPGVAYLEMARAAVAEAAGGAAGRVRLRDVAWIRPLVVRDGPVEVHLRLRRREGGMDFEVSADGVEYCRGAAFLAADVEDDATALDLAEERARRGHERTGAQCYDALRAAGLDYGPSLRAIETLHCGEGRVLARLRGASAVALLDGALQATVGLEGDAGAVPFALGSIEFAAPCTDAMWATVDANLDIDLYDDRGRSCVRIRGVVFRPMRVEAAPDAAAEAVDDAGAPLLFAREWRPAAVRPGALRLSPAGNDAAGRFTSAAAQLLEVLHRETSGDLQVVVDDPLLAGLDGMLRSARQEHPTLRPELVLLRDGQAFAPGWTEFPPPAPAGPVWRPGAVVLVAGAGALGRLLADDVARRAPGSVVVLAARSRHERVDLTDAAEVRALVDRVVARHGRIDVVVHAAAVVRDGPIARKTADELREVLAPKVAGLVNLDEATRHLPLDAFLCFSSSAGALGNAGQADYAAANAFMDAYAEHRNALVARGLRHGRTLSVAWPLWRDGGLRPDAAAEARLRARTGLAPMSTVAGLAALDAAWSSGKGAVLVLSGDAGRLRASLAPAPERPHGEGPGTGRVAGILAAVLDLPVSDLDPDEPLKRYGFDSIALMQFVNRMQAEVSPDVSVAAMAACETLREILDRVPRAAPPSRVHMRPHFPELIRMNTATVGRPVFWIHHGHGGVEAYQPVAEASARPFYGIQPRGWMTDGAILVGQKAMAAHYVSVIRAVQPEGPYDLGGFSLGGLLAYEVTRQLQETGEEVATMVMIDSLDSRATGRANELLRAGAPRHGPVSKGSLFRAVNLLLGGGNFSAREIAARILHRNDVDPRLDEDAFLDHLIALARSRGMDRPSAQLRARTVQLAHYFCAIEEERFAVLPLPDAAAVTCYYVRNRSGIFFGPHEGHMILVPPAPGAVESVDHLDYWREWEENLPGLHVLDVDTADHSELLTADASLDVIRALCRAVYGEGGVDDPASLVAELGGAGAFA